MMSDYQPAYGPREDDAAARHRMWLWEKMGEECVKNLNRHGLDAHLVPTIEAARELVLELCAPYKSFGWAGSDTTRSLGVLEELKKRGAEIHDHWQQGLSQEQDLEIRLAQGRSECFLCSANAISAEGEIVNVDGIGNRTAAMQFGPRHVIVVAGMNKVVPDLASALRRVKEVAGPMRARSLNMETPCAKTGRCEDCNSPQRICRVTTIIHRKPMLTRVSVVLIPVALGF